MASQLDGQQEVKLFGQMAVQGAKLATESVKLVGSAAEVPFKMLDSVLNLAVASKEDRAIAKDLIMQRFGIFEKVNPNAQKLMAHLRKPDVEPRLQFVAGQKERDLFVEKASLYGLDYHMGRAGESNLWQVYTSTDQEETLTRINLAVERETVFGVVTYSELQALSERGVSAYALVIDAKEVPLFAEYAREAGLRVACMPGYQSEDGREVTKLMFDLEHQKDIEAIHNILQSDLRGKHGEVLKEQLARNEATYAQVKDAACGGAKRLDEPIYAVNARGDYIAINSNSITLRISNMSAEQLPRPVRLKDTDAIARIQDKVDYALLRMGRVTVLGQKEFNEFQKINQERRSLSDGREGKLEPDSRIAQLLARQDSMVMSGALSVRDLKILQQHETERLQALDKMDMSDALRQAMARSSIEMLPGMRDVLSQKMYGIDGLSRAEAVIMQEKADANGIWCSSFQRQDGSYTVAFREADVTAAKGIMAATVYEMSDAGKVFLDERIKYEDEIREAAIKDALSLKEGESLHFVVNAEKTVVIDKEGLTVKSGIQRMSVDKDNPLYDRAIEKALEKGSIVRLQPSEFRRYERADRAAGLEILRKADIEQGCPVLSAAAQAELQQHMDARVLYEQKLAQDNPIQEKDNYAFTNNLMRMATFKELEAENKDLSDRRQEAHRLTEDKELTADLKDRMNAMLDKMGNITTQDGRIVVDSLDLTERTDLNQPAATNDTPEPEHPTEPEYVRVNLPAYEREEKVLGGEEPTKVPDRSEQDRDNDIEPEEPIPEDEEPIPEDEEPVPEDEEPAIGPPDLDEDLGMGD